MSRPNAELLARVRQSVDKTAEWLDQHKLSFLSLQRLPVHGRVPSPMSNEERARAFRALTPVTLGNRHVWPHQREAQR